MINLSRNTIWFLLVNMLLLEQIVAEPLKPQLVGGMKYYEVLQLWGAPVEKIEQEALRKDIWLYDNAKVIFDQGKVVLWQSGSLNSQQLQKDEDEATQTVQIDQANVEPAEEQHDEAVEAILKDIMDEGNDDDGNGSAENSPPAPPGLRLPRSPIGVGKPMSIPNARER